MPSRSNPIRLFVSHSWEENEDYNRVFEYLEASGTFYYQNTSQPQSKRPIDKESQREDLRRHVARLRELQRRVVDRHRSGDRRRLLGEDLESGKEQPAGRQGVERLHGRNKSRRPGPERAIAIIISIAFPVPLR